MNIIVFAMRVPDHGHTVVFAVVGGGSNNGVGLFFVEAEFGDRAISAGDESSHSQDLTVRFSERVDLTGTAGLQCPFENSVEANVLY